MRHKKMEFDNEVSYLQWIIGRTDTGSIEHGAAPKKDKKSRTNQYLSAYRGQSGDASADGEN